MFVIKKDDYRVPVMSWCPSIEETAQIQIDNLARLPYIVGRIVVLPDTHAGFGMPIGAVMATADVVVPNAVGKDINCGMLATKTSLRGLEKDSLKLILGGIRKRIPVGRDWHESPISALIEPTKDLPITKTQIDNARLQLGTLGSGNHFCELQVDEEGIIWFMLHSGSRNLGKRIADHYDKLARDLNARWHSSVPESWELAFLPRADPSFSLYMDEMKYAAIFAQQNRDVMAGQVKEAILEVIPTAKFEPAINIAHNYAAFEHIGDRDLLVHRKGATSARAGQIGIIPGSQGTASYIVEGLGNVKSFYSCSHGAGRQLGRAQARKTLDLKAEIEKLDKQGIIHSIRHESDLDEATGAYKDIDEVMKAQDDLVKIVTRLRPIGVIKKQ